MENNDEVKQEYIDDVSYNLKTKISEILMDYAMSVMQWQKDSSSTPDFGFSLKHARSKMIYMIAAENQRKSKIRDIDDLESVEW